MDCDLLETLTLLDVSLWQQRFFVGTFFLDARPFRDTSKFFLYGEDVKICDEHLGRPRRDDVPLFDLLGGGEISYGDNVAGAVDGPEKQTCFENLIPDSRSTGVTTEGVVIHTLLTCHRF